MTFADLDRNPNPRKLRQFGMLCFLVFGAAGLLRGPGWLALAGVGAAGLGLAWPAALRPVFVGASIAAFPLGWLVSRLILAFVYFAILTPIALVSRLSGRDRLKLRGSAPGWEEREPPGDPGSYFRQF